MYRKTVMITGCAGNVGRISLEFLARTPGVGRIIASDLNEERGLCIASNAILSAALSNCYPKIEFLRLDLRDEEQTTTAIKKIKPDVILNTATMYTSYYYYEPLLKIIKKLGVKFHRPAHTIAKDIFL
ncbi:MAG: NAD-dependent epimerase/dehydratase family protein, partial [Candidatus Bathyarchaeia archaeon]